MIKSLEISKIIYLTWKNHYKQLIVQNPFLKIIIPMTAILLFTLLLLLTNQALYPFIESFGLTDPRMIPVIFVALFINLSLLTSISLNMLLLISPERNNIELSMLWLPLTSFQRKAGYYLPLLIIVTFLLSVFYVPILLTMTLALKFTFLQTIVLFGSMFLQITMILFTTLIVFEGVNYLTGHLLNLPFNRALSVSSAGFAILGILFFTLDLNMFQSLYVNMEYNFLYLMLINLTFVSDLFGDFQAGYVVMVHVLALLIFLVFLCSVLLPSSIKDSSGIAFLKRLPFSKNKFLSFAVKEFKETIRNSENILYVIVLSTISLFLAFVLDLGNYYVLLPIPIWIMSSFLSYSSYGREQKTFLMWNAIPYSSKKWIYAKLIANMLLSIGLATILFIVFKMSYPLSILEYYKYLPIGILVTTAAYMIGVIFPYSPKHPYSTAFTAVGGSLIALPAFLLIYKGLEYVPQSIYQYFILFLIAVFSLSLYVLDGWKRKYAD
ncbi:hypothetical protein AB1K32_08145 [Metabacillus dongyingensis]|uniref:hypothetical protein n=1 Tax=Metabacillus dongyingensis TaxID=2874282 RepID=UPI003B8D29D0